MRFTLSVASLAALAGMASAQVSCPEAARFGFTTATPTTGLNSGDVCIHPLLILKVSRVDYVRQQFTITSNFTCSITKGIKPAFVDYYIHNTINNNGHEPPVLVTRRTNPATVDTFTAKVFSFENYVPLIGPDSLSAAPGLPGLVRRRELHPSDSLDLPSHGLRRQPSPHHSPEWRCRCSDRSERLKDLSVGLPWFHPFVNRKRT
jgi:hypothetical protein